MSSFFQDLLSTDPSEVEPKKKPGFTDYLTDIPVGAARGASIAVKELIKIGALPIDYVADTNLISAIDKTFEKISPDVEVGVSDIDLVIQEVLQKPKVSISVA